jgi:hypothetical protein
VARQPIPVDLILPSSSTGTANFDARDGNPLLNGVLQNVWTASGYADWFGFAPALRV